MVPNHVNLCLFTCVLKVMIELRFGLGKDTKNESDSHIEGARVQFHDTGVIRGRHTSTSSRLALMVIIYLGIFNPGEIRLGAQLLQRTSVEAFPFLTASDTLSRICQSRSSSDYHQRPLSSSQLSSRLCTPNTLGRNLMFRNRSSQRL